MKEPGRSSVHAAPTPRASRASVRRHVGRPAEGRFSLSETRSQAVRTAETVSLGTTNTFLQVCHEPLKNATLCPEYMQLSLLKMQHCVLSICSLDTLELPIVGGGRPEGCEAEPRAK